MQKYLYLAALCLAVAAAPAWAASQRTRSTPSSAKKSAANANDKSDTTAAKDAGSGKVVEAGETQKLGGGKIEFTPPEGWTKSDKNSGPTRAAYVSPGGEGMLLVELPPNMQIADGTGDAIIKQLHGMRQKEGSKSLELKAEPDDRFDLRIVDRFTLKNGRDAEQLHLYKKVGSRVVMATVNSVAEDAEASKKIHAAGEDALLSAKAVGPPEKSTGTAKRGSSGTGSKTGSKSSSSSAKSRS
jgi:hypothetical protein